MLCCARKVESQSQSVSKIRMHFVHCCGKCWSSWAIRRGKGHPFCMNVLMN